MSIFKNVTPLGWIGIIILFNSTLLGGAGQLGDLALSPVVVKALLAVATLGNGFLGGLVTMFSGQAAMVKTVAAMPGVDSVNVNSEANKTLAQIAVSGADDSRKVQPTLAAASLVAAIAKSGTNILLVAFVLSAFLVAPAMAQGKLKLPIDPLGLNNQPPINILPGKLTGSAVTDIQGFMNAKFLPDLQYALKLAQASKNNITSDCYQAWIDIITTQQTAVQTKNPDGTTTDLPMPDPHVITEFEKLVELRNALQPESPFMVKCSPVASMIKKDIASFMGIVLTGGAGLATLVPGL